MSAGEGDARERARPLRNADPTGTGNAVEKEDRVRPRGIHLFSVRGIQIRIDYSWFFIFLLVVWSLSAGYLPTEYPGESAAAYWAFGLVATLLFFVSILVHELAHSFMALRSGIPIPDITLFIFGGVSRLSEEAKDPRTELEIAIVGPLTSLALAVVFWLAGAQMAMAPPLAQGVVSYLAWINLAVALFNLVPGYPLDGGRVLRALWWWRSGSLLDATRVASDVGKGFAIVLMLLGGIQIFTGALIGGLWMIFIGMFLRGIAEAGYRDLVVTRQLEGMRVGDVALREVASVPPDLPLPSLLDDYFVHYGMDGFPVARNGEALGVVTLANVKKVPKEDRAELRVEDVMTPLDDADVVRLSAALSDALARFRRGAERLLVVDQNNEVRGLLTESELLRRIEIRQALG